MSNLSQKLEKFFEVRPSDFAVYLMFGVLFGALISLIIMPLIPAIYIPSYPAKSIYHMAKKFNSSWNRTRVLSIRVFCLNSWTKVAPW